MAKKTKPKAKINDVFMHKEEKKTFIVADVGSYPKGHLYTLKEVTNDKEVSYKRYYEEKLLDNCAKAKNAKAIKVLYGKKK
jgi:hypothetical protein